MKDVGKAAVRTACGHGKEGGHDQVDRNVYWLSTKPDAVIWKKTLGAGSGVVYQPDGYADLTGLSKLGAANVAVRASTRRDGADAACLRCPWRGLAPAAGARE